MQCGRARLKYTRLEVLRGVLDDAAAKTDRVRHVRGVGTIMAFDLPTTEERNALKGDLAKHGVRTALKCVRNAPRSVNSFL